MEENVWFQQMWQRKELQRTSENTEYNINTYG